MVENAPATPYYTITDANSNSSLSLLEVGNLEQTNSPHSCQTTSPALTLCNTSFHQHFANPRVGPPNNLEHSPSHASGQEPTSGPPCLCMMQLGRDTTPQQTDAINTERTLDPLSIFLLQPVNEEPWTTLQAREETRKCACRLLVLVGGLEEGLSPASTREIVDLN